MNKTNRYKLPKSSGSEREVVFDNFVFTGEGRGTSSRKFLLGNWTPEVTIPSMLAYMPRRRRLEDESFRNFEQPWKLYM